MRSRNQRGVAQRLSGPLVRQGKDNYYENKIGLFAVNAQTERQQNQILSQEPKPVNLSELPTLPYFNVIEQYGRRIAQYYTINKSIVDQLCL